MASLRFEASKAAVALIVEIDKNVRATTPVDTGHAQRNWVPSVGEPFEGEAASDAEHARGLAELLGYQLDDGTLWLANNVPYIMLLNYGTSTQAPAGFVEAAIDRAIAAVQARHNSIDIGIMQGAFRAEVGARAAGNVASAYSPFGGDS